VKRNALHVEGLHHPTVLECQMELVPAYRQVHSYVRITRTTGGFL
jgi:hypothetical protein